MLFNFRLRPLDQVVPWGGPHKPTLHWFGLTDGEYWIEAGDATIFEYSETAQQAFGGSRYCDYYVVRLHEDLLEKAPYFLEPVADDLQPSLLALLCRDDAEPANLKRRLDAYFDSDRPDDARLDEAIGCVCEFAGCRQVDTSYLINGPKLAFWSDAARTHIVWDTDQRSKDVLRRWSANSGIISLQRGVFIEELKSFHERLMADMDVRLSAVLNGALSPDIQIDIRGLLYDHQKHRREIEAALSPPERPTDWDAVRAAIREVEKIPI